jgi:hypothetical protein
VQSLRTSEILFVNKGQKEIFTYITMKYSLKGHVGDSQRHNRSRDHVTTSEPAWQVSKSFVVAFIISMHGHGLGFHVGSNQVYMRGVTANEQDGK